MEEDKENIKEPKKNETPIYIIAAIVAFLLIIGTFSTGMRYNRFMGYNGGYYGYGYGCSTVLRNRIAPIPPAYNNRAKITVIPNSSGFYRMMY